MKTILRIFVIVVPLCLLAAPAWSGETPAPALDGASAAIPDTSATASMQPDCPASWAVARIKCKNGATGAAVGVYGGSEVSLFCDGDKAEQTLCVNGFSYGVRMSSDSDVSVDCFFQGNGVLNESCGDVQLTIN